MRIIGGDKRKTNLYGPETDKIRPTTDRAKEALFNIINLKIKGSYFLDLFSGSGNISLEAKSRGASNVYAIDKLDASINLIEKNKDKTKLDINIVKQDVLIFLENNKVKFDFIFMDPPFNLENSYIKKIIAKVEEKEILKENGKIIIEREYNKKNEELFSEYGDIDIRKYGKVSFIIIGKR